MENNLWILKRYEFYQASISWDKREMWPDMFLMLLFIVLIWKFFDRKSPCDLLFLSNLSIIVILFDICQFFFYIVLWQIVIFATLVLMWKRVISCVCVHFHLDGEANLEQVGDVMAVAGLLKLFLVRRE